MGGGTNARCGQGASPVAQLVKNPPVNAGDARDVSLFPGSRRLPWRTAWQPTPEFFPWLSSQALAPCGQGEQWSRMLPEVSHAWDPPGACPDVFLGAPLRGLIQQVLAGAENLLLHQTPRWCKCGWSSDYTELQGGRQGFWDDWLWGRQERTLVGGCFVWLIFDVDICFFTCT